MRYLYLSLGFFFLGLAILGAFLPLLPTTPFALLASAMFMRSSPRLNRWLLRNRLLGPFLRDWQRHRGVRLSVKITAIVTILLVGGATLYWVEMPPWLQVVFVVLLLIGLIVVLRLRLIRNGDPEASAAGEVRDDDSHGTT
jgi:uncharacterized membrane protein YbaN (DUF454 family)